MLDKSTSFGARLRLTVSEQRKSRASPSLAHLIRIENGFTFSVKTVQVLFTPCLNPAYVYDNDMHESLNFVILIVTRNNLFKLGLM